MAGSCWRIASGLLLVPAAVAGMAGCSNGAGSTAASSSTATSAANGALTAATLREALLTRVNGVAAARAPARRTIKIRDHPNGCGLHVVARFSSASPGAPRVGCAPLAAVSEALFVFT